MSSLFRAADETKAVDATGVSVTFTNVAGNAAGTFNKNSSDWTASTLKFTGTGVIKVTVKQFNAQANENETAAELYLEVVNATNATAATSVTSTRNVVLLNDISITSSLSITAGTLYGNGFTIDATGTAQNGTTKFSSLGAALNLSSGTLNNVRVIGPTLNSAAVFYSDENNAFTVKTSGECYIYNSYIYGSRATIGMYGTATSSLTVENSVLDGGRFGNIYLRFGALNLHNVTTISQPRTTVNGNTRCGYGIVISDEAGTDAQITATGYLKQYNWVGKNKDVNYFKGDSSNSTSNTAMSSIFSNMYDKASSLTVSYNGDKYINTGILSLSNNAPKATGEALSGYSSANVSLGSFNGWVMAPTSLDSSNDFKYYSDTAYSPSEQVPTVPTFTWSYLSTYSSSENQVNLSYESGSSVTLDPNILTAAKYGNSLSVSIKMNNTDYTGKSITFSSAGTYTIEYTVTDPYNYAADGVTATTRTYKKYLTVSVSEIVASIKAPEFTFYNTSGTSLGSKTVDIGGKHYVMPNVTATDDYVKSSTVSGTTVYAPVVTVRFKDNSSDFNYLFPIFTGVKIKNYTNESGANTTYSKTDYTGSSLPSVLEVVSKDPDWNGKTSFNTYERNSTYGLYAKSAAIGSNQSVRTATIEYKFTAGNGESYYYRIYFSAAAHDKPTCVAEGTMVTMANGTQKAVEDLQQGDMVMTWSMWNGRYEAQPVAVKWYHGTRDWEVLTLKFSDKTEVRIINEHGFFDADKNTYAYIRKDNVSDYIGDKFIKHQADGSNAEVTLTDYELTEETVGSYSIQTAYNENFIVENMLSMTGEDYRGRFEYFDIGEGMKYDEVKMQQDIKTYGLYTYEDFSDYLTPMQFEMFNGAYFKVLVGKGVLTYEDIIEIISANL